MFSDGSILIILVQIHTDLCSQPHLRHRKGMNSEPYLCLCTYSMQAGDIQFLLSYYLINSLLINDNRGEATQLRNTDPRNAWPCWIDGHHQLASSDEFDRLEGSPANKILELGLKYRF
jgi:hypothetical protein